MFTMQNHQDKISNIFAEVLMVFKPSACRNTILQGQSIAVFNPNNLRT